MSGFVGWFLHLPFFAQCIVITVQASLFVIIFQSLYYRQRLKKFGEQFPSRRRRMILFMAIVLPYVSFMIWCLLGLPGCSENFKKPEVYLPALYLVLFALFLGFLIAPLVRWIRQGMKTEGVEK